MEGYHSDAFCFSRGIIFSPHMDLVSILTSKLLQLRMRFSKIRESWNCRHEDRYQCWTSSNVIQHQLPFGVSPMQVLAGCWEGTAKMRDTHGRRITLLACSCHTAAPHCRCGMCRPSLGLSNAGASLPWFWPTFPLSIHVKSASRQRRQKTALKNVSCSSWDLQVQQNPWQIVQDLVGEALPCPLMRNICTTLYTIFGNVILRNHPVKIRVKRNKITVVII